MNGERGPMLSLCCITCGTHACFGISDKLVIRRTEEFPAVNFLREEGDKEKLDPMSSPQGERGGMTLLIVQNLPLGPVLAQPLSCITWALLAGIS